MAKPEPNRQQLDRAAWVKAALDILAGKGLDGIRVEVLAKRLGVTKGSFYWHFKDRRDLLDTVLETWKDGRIRDIQMQTRAVPGEELPRAYHVIDIYSANRNRKGMLIEIAMRDWARRDAAAAAAVVEEVDAARLEFGRRGFMARGMSELEASSRSLLLYAYVFGLSLMSCGKFDADMDEMKRWIADRIAR
ncbi:MAG: TetR/AcrR family transcriptional regulator [Zoogloeaceae bacterium]|nr:TetR/AcrR family transcriptional regulator [Zoogloeaceae bacterium]MCK6382758.1 TetR/AcrR family transcriptional regulator [Rhodocyclaceae bacterium]